MISMFNNPFHIKKNGKIIEGLYNETAIKFLDAEICIQLITDEGKLEKIILDETISFFQRLCSAICFAALSDEGQRTKLDIDDYSQSIFIYKNGDNLKYILNDEIELRSSNAWKAYQEALKYWYGETKLAVNEGRLQDFSHSRAIFTFTPVFDFYTGLTI